MKRLFFLVPQLSLARTIVDELKAIGVTDQNVHVVGGIPEVLRQEHLHRANITQTSDLIPALKRGAMMGVVLSVVIYTLFSLFLPPSIKFHVSAVLGILFFGIGFGIWASGMVGIGIKNSVVEKYENYVKEGHYIMMVDVPNEREQELSSQVIKHHPDAQIAVAPVH
jgi:hypothetical protein